MYLILQIFTPFKISEIKFLAKVVLSNFKLAHKEGDDTLTCNIVYRGGMMHHGKEKTKYEEFISKRA